MNSRTYLIAAMTVLVCTACGASIIKGQPPFISISAMTMTDEKLSADFDIRNLNGQMMTIEGIEIRVEVNEVELTRYNSDFSLIVGPNTTEEVHVDDLPDEFALDLLASLEAGEIKSLPFRLDGRVNTLEDGYLAFRHKGYLYPVPGRPGQFRSATTQSGRVSQDDPQRQIDDRP